MGIEILGLFDNIIFDVIYIQWGSAASSLLYEEEVQ
jgi:hypothetical protein